MVRRATYQESFKQVAMPQNTGEAQALAGLANSVGALIQTKQKQDELKITNYSSQADLDMLQATSEYRNKMALDPMNHEAQEKLSTDYDKIFAQYDNKIGINAKGKWNKTKNILKQQYKVANGKWVLAQNVKNGESNLKEGIESSLKKGYISGIEGDYQTAMESAGLKELQLRESAEGLVSQDQLEEDMKNFKSDYTKNFIMGRISRNPDEASKLLETREVKDAIGSEEAEKLLNNMIDVKIKQDNLAIKRVQYKGREEFTSSMDKRTVGENIQELELGKKNNKFSDKWADSMQRAILSTKGIDAVSQAELYGDFLDRKADILADFKNGSQDSKSYLRSVEKYEIDMNNATASGKIKKLEGMKAIQSLRKEIGSATTELKGESQRGFDERKAYRGMEKQLTGQALYQAKRDYFYTIDGKDYKSDELEEMYNVVLEGAKTDSRENALNILDGIENREEAGILLKSSVKAQDKYVSQEVRESNGIKALVGVKEDGTLEIIKEY